MHPNSSQLALWAARNSSCTEEGCEERECAGDCPSCGAISCAAHKHVIISCKGCNGLACAYRARQYNGGLVGDSFFCSGDCSVDYATTHEGCQTHGCKNFSTVTCKACELRRCTRHYTPGHVWNCPVCRKLTCETIREKTGGQQCGNLKWTCSAACHKIFTEPLPYVKGKGCCTIGCDNSADSRLQCEHQGIPYEYCERCAIHHYKHCSIAEQNWKRFPEISDGAKQVPVDLLQRHVVFGEHYIHPPPRNVPSDQSAFEARFVFAGFHVRPQNYCVPCSPAEPLAPVDDQTIADVRGLYEEKPCQEEEKNAPATPDGDETLCVVCMDATRTHLIVPCGHMILCAGCASKEHKTCPICRVVVQMTMRVIIS